MSKKTIISHSRLSSNYGSFRIQDFPAFILLTSSQRTYYYCTILYLMIHGVSFFFQNLEKNVTSRLSPFMSHHDLSQPVYSTLIWEDLSANYTDHHEMFFYVFISVALYWKSLLSRSFIMKLLWAQPHLIIEFSQNELWKK